MSVDKPFASVCEFDEGVWIVDSPDEDRSADVYAVCRNDKSEAERIAALLNAAVTARERKAKAQALRDAAKKWPKGRGKFKSEDFGLWLEAEAAAVEKGGPL